jgi:hypothetical protein
MAFVIARRGGRFEIRESVQTQRGPRARTLANFSVLTEEVLRRAAGRASREFDQASVIASAIRRGAPLAIGLADEEQIGAVAGASSSARFVTSARRFSQAIQDGPWRAERDSGEVLIDLIGFADEVTRHKPPRTPTPLEYPALNQLAASRTAS